MLCWFCRVEASHVSDDTTLLRQETEDRVNDSLILRWFCRVYFEQVPDDTTLIRWAQLIRQQTLHALNDRVVELVTQAKVIKGRRIAPGWNLCADHHPPSDRQWIARG